MIKTRLLKFALICLIMLSPLHCKAANWNTNYIQFSDGSHFKLGDKHRKLFMFNHSSSWRLGENSFFLESINPTSNRFILTGEFAPSFSVSKLARKKVGEYPAIETLFAAKFNWNELGHRENSFGLDIYYSPPYKIDYVMMSYLLRRDSAYQHSTFAIIFKTRMKVLPEWALDFLADLTLRSQGEKKRNYKFKLNLAYDFGHTFYKRDCVFLGMGYSFWKNKFGVAGVIERSPTLFLRIYI